MTYTQAVLELDSLSLPAEIFQKVIKLIAAAFQASEKYRASGAARQKRYRDRTKPSRNVTNNVTCDVTSNVTQLPLPSPLPPSLSPSPIRPLPLTHPPTPLPSISEDEKISAAQTPKPKSKSSRLPPDWVPSARNVADAKLLRLTDPEIRTQAARIRDWSASAKNGVKLDWDAAWRNWCGRFIDGLPPTDPRSPQARPRGYRDPRL